MSRSRPRSSRSTATTDEMARAVMFWPDEAGTSAIGSGSDVTGGFLAGRARRSLICSNLASPRVGISAASSSDLAGRSCAEGLCRGYNH